MSKIKICKIICLKVVWKFCKCFQALHVFWHLSLSSYNSDTDKPQEETGLIKTNHTINIHKPLKNIPVDVLGDSSTIESTCISAKTNFWHRPAHLVYIYLSNYLSWSVDFHWQSKCMHFAFVHALKRKKSLEISINW